MKVKPTGQHLTITSNRVLPFCALYANLTEWGQLRKDIFERLKDTTVCDSFFLRMTWNESRCVFVTRKRFELIFENFVMWLIQLSSQKQQ